MYTCTQVGFISVLFTVITCTFTQTNQYTPKQIHTKIHTHTNKQIHTHTHIHTKPPVCVPPSPCGCEKIVEFSPGFLWMSVTSLRSDVDMKDGIVFVLMRVMLGLVQLVTLGEQPRETSYNKTLERSASSYLFSGTFFLLFPVSIYLYFCLFIYSFVSFYYLSVYLSFHSSISYFFLSTLPLDCCIPLDVISLALYAWRFFIYIFWQADTTDTLTRRPWRMSGAKSPVSHQTIQVAIAYVAAVSFILYSIFLFASRGNFLRLWWSAWQPP